ncbi:hypothetical protein [Nostoc commune]|uniref:hypothetical protein n=1 Tax=Nostoc commune TaxID=1178 RepID=UPI0018C6A1A9|nr:hypothetical protein [Nostoc commune]MBG1257881.1 hypothetical protein [Nostoc commune BAE]
MRIKQFFQIIPLVILTMCLIVAPTLLSISTNKLETVAIAQTTNIVPSRYVGVWRGNGIQLNNTQWSILITLISGKVDSIIGTIAYPSLNCGGELSLQRVNKSSIEISEDITYGSCIDNGIITLQQASARKLTYAWRKNFSSETATGSVQKISSN